MRMPMGVPVVRPSNTPDRIRTSSPSRRWLTKCEVPVRRRSMSGCRSASLRGSPGGQPSTMQPRAGPWLSPNVVTVNSLPMELPDIFMRCAPIRRRCSYLLQLLSGQEEDAAAAALKVEPHERELAEGPSHRRLGVPHLDDQQSSRAQMLAGFPQNNPYGVQARAARGERDPRLVTILGRQIP